MSDQPRPGTDQAPDLGRLRRRLSAGLPGEVGPGEDLHEAAWALADRFDRAGLTEHAALCRSPRTHRVLAVRQWTRSFPAVPEQFWAPALATLEGGADEQPAVPDRVRHSVNAARALLELVGDDGVPVTTAGHLTAAAVGDLDDRFRWTDDFPWLGRATAPAEDDVPPLRFLHEHLLAQRLLTREGDRLVRTESGHRSADEPARLWRALVDPRPRWSRWLERDALGVAAASVLRTRTFTPRVAEEVVRVLARGRRTTGTDLVERVSRVVQEWYQVGVPLGWWDTGHGPADRRPNAYGRAAAAALLRTVRAPTSARTP